jgi:GNAT superfamily N-acetyltransferase
MTGTVEFREATASDRDAILALRALAFPDDDAEKRRPDFWEWEFAHGYAATGRVFVAESGGGLAGHFAFVPQRYEFGNGQTVRGALAVDVMTHPDFRRQRVFSRLASFAAGKLRNDFQVVIAFQIRDAVVAGMEAGGWRAVQQIPVLLKPVSLRRIAQDFGVPLGSRMRSQPRVATADDSIRLLRDDDFEQVDALLATSNIRQRRTAGFLRWRYRQNPHWQYAIDGLFEGEELQAFLVHRDTVLRGLRSLAIADVGVCQGKDAALRRLFRQVTATCHDRGVGVAAAFLSRSHPAYRALRRCGFVRGPHRFNLLLQVFDDSLRHVSDETWSLSWGDTDHL